MHAEEEKDAQEPGPISAEAFSRFAASHIAAIKARMAAAGQITAADRSDLLALANLQVLSPPPRPHRWIPVTLFLVTLSVTALLFFTHVHSARIDFQGDVSELSFTTLAAHELPFPDNLKSLALAGAEPIDLSGLGPLPMECRNVEPQNLRLTAAGSEQHRSSISLSELTIPAGSVVTLSYNGAPFSSNILILTQRNAIGRVSPNITASGAIQVIAQGCKLDLKADTHPQLLVNFAQGEQANFSMVGSEDADPQDLELPVHNVELFRVDPSITTSSNGTGGPNALLRSSILSGTLYFDSVPGVTRNLRIEELLRFKDLTGMLRIVRVSKDHLSIRFTGTIKGLSTGEGNGNENIMPTCFEWLSAGHGFLALCASGLYVFGLVLGFAKWWGLKV